MKQEYAVRYVHHNVYQIKITVSSQPFSRTNQAASLLSGTLSCCVELLGNVFGRTQLLHPAHNREFTASALTDVSRSLYFFYSNLELSDHKCF